MIMKIVAIIICFCILTALTPSGAFAAQPATVGLTAKQQGIVPIAAFAAQGDMAKLKTALEEGLDAGLTINEVKQVLVQMYAYCGFPRSLNALAVFSDTLSERVQRGIKDEPGKEASPFPPDGKSSLELGTEVQTKLVGSPVKGGLMDFAPDIDLYLKAHLFGDIFGRDNLDWQSREVATVAALASMEGTGAQLRAHLGISMNVGVSAEQLSHLVGVLGAKVGKHIGDDAGKILEEVRASR